MSTVLAYAMLALMVVSFLLFVAAAVSSIVYLLKEKRRYNYHTMLFGGPGFIVMGLNGLLAASFRPDGPLTMNIMSLLVILFGAFLLHFGIIIRRKQMSEDK